MKYYVIPFIILIYSCSSKLDPLEYALDLAKDNRSELEHVLDHYGTDIKDSLKLKAAKYLIENMPSHYSYILNDSIVRSLDSIEIMMDSLKDGDYQIRENIYRECLVKYGKNSFKKVEDVEVIPADFLIKNIEHSFSVWTEQTWSQHLSFEEFCDLLLPYKIFEGQILDNWKELLFQRYNHLLSNLSYSSISSKSSYIACDILNEALRKDINPELNSTAHMPILRIKTLLQIPSGACDEYTALSNAVMIANGIPVGTDFTPQWPFRSQGHSWNFLHENTKKNLVFEGAGPTVGTPHKKDHIMAKVYRKTFKRNTAILKLLKDQSITPRTFNSPFIEDVTTEYLSTVDLQIEVSSNDKYVYLAVFNNKTWRIIAFGKCKNGLASFQHIGKDVLYLPVSFDENGASPIADPFIVHLNGEIKPIKFNPRERENLTLYRKFPLLPRAYGSSLRKLGIKIQAANEKDFSDSVTFHTFKDLENDIEINSKRQFFRFWRALSTPGGHSSIAELSFYENENKFPAEGVIIGTGGSFREGDKYKKEAVFDGDLLTFFDAQEHTGSWVGLDFRKPTAITRIVCFMRGDGNDIEREDEYELVYWTDRGWVSLGRKTANDIYIEFDNCPTEALFLLHNRTKGKEERIFTYEKGKQVWW